jgi:hypothetical protein
MKPEAISCSLSISIERWAAPHARARPGNDFVVSLVGGAGEECFGHVAIIALIFGHDTESRSWRYRVTYGRWILASCSAWPHHASWSSMDWAALS